MQFSKTMFAALLLSGFAVSQGQMPIPNYSYTYSSSSGTRGFYFQAPVSFTITGLRVPDEKKFGKQNVGVYVLATKPGSNVTATPVFFSAGQSSAKILPTNISIAKGKWVVILGNAGDATIQHNSYGNVTAPGYSSNILGQKTLLNRVWTNTNFITAQGKGAFNASTGPMGRVEVYIKGQKPLGTATAFGKGSANKKIGSPFPVPPAYQRTYGDSRGYPRGFYFTAPTTFLVTGLRVPNESKHKFQTVALYKMAKVPPAYPQSVAGTPVFFTKGVAAGTIIKLSKPVVYKANDVLVVLGSNYDANSNTLYSSYSAGPGTSYVLGKKVTMRRIIMQASLLSNSGKGPIATNGAFNIGRVEVMIAGQSNFPPFKVPSLAASGDRPGFGLKPSLDFDSGFKALGGMLFASPLKLPTAVPTPYGNLLIVPNFFLIAPIPGGKGTLTFPLPNDPKLNGAKVEFQGFGFDPVQNTFGLSNGIEWVIGL